MASILSASGCGLEAMPRLWHTSEQTDSKVLVHGGRTKDYSESTKRRLSSVMEVFDAYTESGQQKRVTGKAPATGVYSAARTAAEDDLFSFGWSNGSRFFNALHRLKDG